MALQCLGKFSSLFCVMQYYDFLGGAAGYGTVDLPGHVLLESPQGAPGFLLF